ncbi:hypothetical protein KA517_02775 [Candidatus Gracilibacteria bacterium]|nr:hypothetical protein [Candidatus Gracilibacteria bacterium]
MTKKAVAHTHQVPVAESKKQNQEEVLAHEIRLLRKELRLLNSWPRKLFSALLVGFGTVMGATVVVALVIFILTQLASIEFLKPLVEKVVDIVQNTRR